MSESGSYSPASENHMSIIKDTIKQGITKDSVKTIDDAAERLKVWAGSCEKNMEPDYELLKRHLEVWITRYPEEMKAFLEHRKQTLNENLNKFGSSKGGLIRKLMEMPPLLYKLFVILSPNCFGDAELTPENRIKRVKTFLKHFPVFQACEKL